MRGFVGEEALSVFSDWGVIGDAARNARHGGYRVFSRDPGFVCFTIRSVFLPTPEYSHIRSASFYKVDTK